MNLELNIREIQMLCEAINTQICELYSTMDIYSNDEKILKMLQESVDGYTRLLATIQGRE